MRAKEIMNKTLIVKVDSQGDVSYVPSRKVEGGQTAKCTIRLRELGGSNANEYVCTTFGNLALCVFHEGDVVAASLRFRAHESSGNFYQDVTINEMVKLNSK